MDLNKIRSQFPALDRPAIFLDNPAGTQIAQMSIDRINKYLLESNANHGGVFETSRQSDALLDQARTAWADFVNAKRKEEIIFGPNMTSLTFNLSRSLANTLQKGDHVVVTRLDHDANITPWTIIAEERGCHVHHIDFDVEQGTLQMDSVEKALSFNPKLVSIGYASNALGTINPVKTITKMAKSVGSLVFVDAVQYAPHGIIDVQDIGCDFLAASAYKIYGPHLGMLYGRYELLDELNAYKLRPPVNKPPDKFETGTQNHEGIAGLLGALEYIQWLGEHFGEDTTSGKEASSQQEKLHKGMKTIHTYELQISRKLIEIFNRIPSVRMFGLSDMESIHQRVPTFAIRVKDMHPHETAEKLAAEGIYVWDGNYYAVSVTDRLGVEESGGMVRIGPVHYNTLDEIEHLAEVLHKIALG